MRTEFHCAAWDRGELGYILSAPDVWDRELPFLIYLHGAGERGTVLEHLQRHAIPKMIHAGVQIPALVLCPQCPAGYVWNNVVRELKSLIDRIAVEYRIKPDRICLTGSSMGGYGTWEMAMTYRNFFSGIAPVCGGGMAWRAANLHTTPVRTWHGDADDVVTIASSREMVEAVNAWGGHATLHVLPGFSHNDGIEEVYTNTDLITWLLDCRRVDYSYVPEVCEEMF